MQKFARIAEILTKFAGRRPLFVFTTLQTIVKTIIRTGRGLCKCKGNLAVLKYSLIGPFMTKITSRKRTVDTHQNCPRKNRCCIRAMLRSTLRPVVRSELNILPLGSPSSAFWYQTAIHEVVSAVWCPQLAADKTAVPPSVHHRLIIYSVWWLLACVFVQTEA